LGGGRAEWQWEGKKWQWEGKKWQWEGKKWQWEGQMAVGGANGSGSMREVGIIANSSH